MFAKDYHCKPNSPVVNYVAVVGMYLLYHWLEAVHFPRKGQHATWAGTRLALQSLARRRRHNVCQGQLTNSPVVVCVLVMCTFVSGRVGLGKCTVYVATYPALQSLARRSRHHICRVLLQVNPGSRDWQAVATLALQLLAQRTLKDGWLCGVAFVEDPFRPTQSGGKHCNL
jgi:hypothetical protein